MEKIARIQEGVFNFDLPGPYSSIPLADKEKTLYAHISEYSKTIKPMYHAIIEAVKKSALPRGPEVYKTLFPKYRGYKSILFRIMLFDLYDELLPPNFLVSSGASYYFLNEEFKSVVDFYVQEVDKRHEPRRGSLLASFFLQVQRLGAESLCDISKKIIDSYFLETKTRIRTKTKIKIARQLEKCEGLRHDGNCKRIAGYFPRRCGKEKKYDAFSEKERLKVRSCIYEPSNLTKLEKAYGMLALTYGIRKGDIQHLKLKDIDWKLGELSFVQQKTGEPVSLKLAPAVLNAIFEYIKYDRPKCDSAYVFLSPYKRAGTHTLINADKIAHSIYEKAGINLNRGNIGTHQFRHICATGMLEAGIQKVVVSRILGQTSPTALNAYVDHYNNVKIKDFNIDIPEISPCNKYYGNKTNK